ncbi:FAD-dependent oxidoreductase [Xylophilus rhododendri]|uniref:FAD-dependent oxidoreductase n=1 Tax=Xylophilus rhododendri TaxID=2697032 RepID=A0A857J6N0_9BURK|nr:GMC family oxidoreductase [Xylophilus rhododendri]QHI98448.1 FAD-dependent oxidoreductase [Xylophilus rhododendri]
MIIEASSVADGTQLETDICIVGAGIAGISMALRLAARGRRILLLESGHLGYDEATQALYRGSVADENLHSPPDKYRQRRFGGASAIWGGRCMPFDPLDFDARPHVPHSGWPIGYETLEPYYRDANRLAEAGTFEYDAERAFGPEAAPMIRGFGSEVLRTDGIERFSCPTNFAARYRQRLELADDIQVLLGANCTGIGLDAAGTRVRGVEVATLAGRRFCVTPRQTVLAMGGLETARLLLASRDVVPAGIGNQHDVVGRYYMCHIAGNVGTLAVQGEPDRVRHGYERSPEGIYCRRRLSLTAAEQSRLGVANMVARLHFPRITDPAHGSAVLSGLFMARQLISYEYGKRLKDSAPQSLSSRARHLWNIVSGPLDTSGFLWHWLTRRSLAVRKFPSVILRNRHNRFSLEVHGEQMPHPDSRVTLGDEVDALGMPRIRIDWRYSPADIESVRNTLKAFQREFARSGIASFDYDDRQLEQDLTRFGAYGGHHIGTARMGLDPRSSVVDANCKVHSVGNLFIAGSAVFPTSSQANPTLTLLALSLRLADHLAPPARADAGIRGARARAVAT